ncbi:TrkH family potassium uptake protein [Bacillus timonensis]|nr:TrkH family potassium uptake protein [Bacillus timonensis]
MRFYNVKISAPHFLILTFLTFMVIGTLLLKLPIATHDSITWVNALFTVTSALTVTGLTAVDTPSTFTTFGELVLLSLIQLGGLGIMSFAVLIFMMLGKKIGLKERLVLQQALNTTSVGGIIRLAKSLFIFSFTIELIAMCLLATRWVPEFGWKQGFYISFFHSISAFNNAGFSLFSNNLMNYVGDPVINIIISLLFVTGGIGFTVLMDMWQKRTFKKLSLHSKLMIIGTFIINMIAMLFFFLAEFNNAGTIGELSIFEKLWASFFQAGTLRTAGFNSIDIGNISDFTALLMILLMFIGAGSASTGGGIKLTTFIIIFLAVVTFFRGKKSIVVYRRTIKDEMIIKALAISMMSITVIFLSIMVLAFFEEAPLMLIAFEVVSAFGTVGLSMNFTPHLTTLGKLVITFMMFFGKIGSLTLAYSLAKPDRTKIKYPSEDILAG